VKSSSSRHATCYSILNSTVDIHILSLEVHVPIQADLGERERVWESERGVAQFKSKQFMSTILICCHNLLCSFPGRTIHTNQTTTVELMHGYTRNKIFASCFSTEQVCMLCGWFWGSHDQVQASSRLNKRVVQRERKIFFVFRLLYVFQRLSFIVLWLLSRPGIHLW